MYKFGLEIELEEDEKYKPGMASNVTLEFANELDQEATKKLMKMSHLVRMQMLGNDK